MEEKEIDLRDYVNVMIKRKWIIITVFLVTVITTAIISFLMPQVYEASAVVENGFINGEVIEKLNSKDIIISTEILDKVIEGAKIDMSISDLRGIIDVKNIKKTSYFEIVTQAESPHKAKEICGILVSAYLDYGNKLYGEREHLIKEELRKILEQKEKVKADTDYIEETILKLSSPERTVSPETMSKIILLQNILSGNRGQILQLNAQENSKNLVLVVAKKFRVINVPEEPGSPIKPKKKLNIAISAVIGLILGVFLAFFVDYWKNPHTMQS